MSDSVKIETYGKWDSPITADLLSSGTIHLEGVQVDVRWSLQLLRCNPVMGKLTNEKQSTGTIFALESRPSEGGRFAIVEVGDSSARDVLPAEFDAAGSIHEYGGGTIAMHPNGNLIFTSNPTNGVYLLDPKSGKVQTIVKPDPSVRFGNFSIHPTTQDWILAVQEAHGKDSVSNTIVSIEVKTGKVSSVAEGCDFYQHPYFSPDGKQVCWIQWNHPDMPWTGSVLHTAKWESGHLLKGSIISGAAGVESICQPRWSPDGTLFFVSDKTGFWQLYRLDVGTTTPRLVHLEGLEHAEFGSREPSLGNCTYVLLDKSTLVASVTQNATSNLVLINLDSETYTDLSLDLVAISKNAMARLSPTSFVVIGSTRTVPQALYRVDLSNNVASITLLKDTVKLSIPSTLLSEVQHISYPRTYGKNRSGSAHGMFVAPKNPAFKAPAETKPPLLVWMHGGPTTHVTPGLDLQTQYWTSRGYAYVHVNYAGSTGYGRAYRELLDAEWGLADIADAASCVKYLASKGLIDDSKVGIVGESAGGYSVLQALYTYPDIWAGGVCLYGISNLQEFVESTHKFESQYAVGLVLKKGLSKEEQEAVYKSRSACYHAETIKASLLLLQGSADTIVPEAQTREMERVMRELGKSVDMVVFEGEGHGWSRGETIKASIEKEREFWAKVL